jgi:valyl-tRNA synthetase
MVDLPKQEKDPAGREKLAREIAQLEGEALKTRTRLADSSFMEKAPAPVVEKNRRQLTELEERIARLRGNLAGAP